MILQLPQPAKLSAVDINLSSTGTEIQIFSATSDSPASLKETTPLTQPTPVQSGGNRIPVTMSSSTSYVLVWISKLGTTNGVNQSSIYEISLEAAH